jgi:hypothetical protein
VAGVLPAGVHVERAVDIDADDRAAVAHRA